MVKINNKIAILIVLIIILIIGWILFFYNKNSIVQDNKMDQSQIGQDNEKHDIKEDSNSDKVSDFEYKIESTSSNKIEKDNIEAKSINLKAYGDELEVKTTLHNNSSEKIEGYVFEIELLDENGNTMTTISENSTDVIEAGESREIINYVVGLENQDQIRNAKITKFEKSSIEN